MTCFDFKWYLISNQHVGTDQKLDKFTLFTIFCHVSVYVQYNAIKIKKKTLLRHASSLKQVGLVYSTHEFQI